MADTLALLMKQYPLFDTTDLAALPLEERSQNCPDDTQTEGLLTSTETLPVSVPEEKYSKFVVYVDESGDHGMQNIDGGFPVFVLAFCVFNKLHYTHKVVPAIEDLKFRHFGHDLIVLHENEIRRQKGDFKKFNSPELRSAFMSDITDVIESSNFILISCIVDKVALKASVKGRQAAAPNPYHIALGFCLETLHDFLAEKNKKRCKLT